MIEISKQVTKEVEKAIEKAIQLVKPSQAQNNILNEEIERLKSKIYSMEYEKFLEKMGREDIENVVKGNKFTIRNELNEIFTDIHNLRAILLFNNKRILVLEAKLGDEEAKNYLDRMENEINND